MYNVTVQLTKTDTPLPAGVIFGHTNLTVTDAAGVVQAFALSGAETPPWSQVVAGLADGASTYVAQDVDSNGASINVAAVSVTFTPPVVTFPGTSAISVTLA
jgi:hypothetical protein